MSNLENILPLNSWFTDLKLTSQIIIAGPCSAETEQQVLDTAIQLKKFDKVKIFRAGIWKPRTRPGSFEGKGEEALKWLKKVKTQTKLKTCVEVASPEHIELAVKYEVDILWIGARTVANPFAIQALADTLKDYNIPVMIKNPINPDIELWQGAIERINGAGINKIAAIHRGFYPFEKTNLRNIPKWEIPIELKTRFNNLPIIGDPSHISGTTEYIKDIAQKGLDLNFDGLMIETHINPKQALSDAKQQLTPSELNNLVSNLHFRTDSTVTNIAEIELLREQIDSVDNQMLELLAKRMDIIEKIGNYKKKNDIAVFQLRRWEKIISTRKDFGNSLGLNIEFIKKILQIIHKESIMRQNKLMN